jgi:thiamine kinase-like enzyme
MGNLGSRPTGETVVLDWAYPGEAPPAWELAWYLALNRSRIPESKSDTIARYRQALEGAGVSADTWWDRQLDLCLLAMAATMGWEKAVGDTDELAWWSERAQEAAARWL